MASATTCAHPTANTASAQALLPSSGSGRGPRGERGLFQPAEPPFAAASPAPSLSPATAAPSPSRPRRLCPTPSAAPRPCRPRSVARRPHPVARAPSLPAAPSLAGHAPSPPPSPPCSIASRAGRAVPLCLPRREDSGGQAEVMGGHGDVDLVQFEPAAIDCGV
nr:vegetative cell wall protein gp1-like [Aegilops tauschii subsp. strangulata]